MNETNLNLSLWKFLGVNDINSVIHSGGQIAKKLRNETRFATFQKVHKEVKDKKLDTWNSFLAKERILEKRVKAASRKRDLKIHYPFFSLFIDLLKYDKISLPQLTTLGLIWFRTNQGKGTCWAAQPNMAKDLNIEVRTLQRHLKALINQKIIIRDKKRHKNGTFVYRVSSKIPGDFLPVPRCLLKYLCITDIALLTLIIRKKIQSGVNTTLPEEFKELCLMTPDEMANHLSLNTQTLTRAYTKFKDTSQAIQVNRFAYLCQLGLIKEATYYHEIRYATTCFTWPIIYGLAKLETSETDQQQLYLPGLKETSEKMTRLH